MKWLRRLWNHITPKKVNSSEESPFSPWYTYGNHLYRQANECAEVIFTDPETGEKKMIVNNNGFIVNFPGIQKQDFWMKEISRESFLYPEVRFRTEFSKYDKERYIMRWQVQPDGRYWADEDGYGWEIDSEIVLYAFIDLKGDFMGPFRIYRIGSKEYL